MLSLYKKPTKKRTSKKRKYTTKPRVPEFKKAKFEQQVVTYYPSLKWRLPLPPRYRTSMVARNTGYVAAGAVSAGMFQVSFNGLQNPFQQTNAIPNNGLPLGTDPVGYGTLVDIDKYRQYRIFASEITLQTLCASAADQMLTVIIPAENGFAGGNYVNQLGRPLSVDGSYSQQQDNKKLKNFKKIEEVAGVSTVAIVADVSGQLQGTVTATPVDLYTWYIYYLNPMAATLVGNVAWSVEVKYWVELWDMKTNDIE